jgi:acid phosphatase class B
MILTEGRLREIIKESVTREPVVTFDFDDTLARRDAKNLVLHPRLEIVDKLIRAGVNPGCKVFIVTRRDEAQEGEETRRFLDENGLTEYIDGIRFTSGMPKRDFLIDVGSRVHYDDNIEDVLDAEDVGIVVHHVT